jgi:hypothetical protein
MKCLKQFAVLVSCLFSLFAKSQNAKEEMKKMNEAYLKHVDLTMDIAYNVYANWTDASPIEKNSGFYMQHGTDRYNKLNRIESVQNKECALVIDNEEKMILVGNPVKFDPAKITMLNLDTAFSKYASVTPIKVSAPQKGYKLIFKTSAASEYEAVDIYFNTKTYLMEKMVFYYRNKVQLQKTNRDEAKEKPRLEIIFSKVSTAPNPDLKLYSEPRFIAKTTNSYRAVGTYSSYKLVNQKTAN